MKNYIARDTSSKLQSLARQVNDEIARLKKLSSRLYDLSRDIDIAISEEETDELEELDLNADDNS